jgi:hypothetical protein
MNFLKTFRFDFERINKIPRIKKYLCAIIYSYNNEAYTLDLPALCYEPNFIKMLADADVSFDHDIYFIGKDKDENKKRADKAKVSLCISSFNCAPEEITSILGVSPTYTWKKGDRPDRRSIKKYRYSCWVYEVERTNITYAVILLSDLIDVFKDKVDNFYKLPKESYIAIEIITSSENEDPLFFFNKAYINFIDKIGAEIKLNLCEDR